MSQNNNFAHHV